MAVGWAKDGAEQEQIEATVNDALEIARRNLPQGQESAEFTARTRKRGIL